MWIGAAVTHQAGDEDVAKVLHITAPVDDNAATGVVAGAAVLSRVACSGDDEIGPAGAEALAEVVGALAGGGRVGGLGDDVDGRDQGCQGFPALQAGMSRFRSLLCFDLE